jgi:hypothetical protein
MRMGHAPTDPQVQLKANSAACHRMLTALPYPIAKPVQRMHSGSMQCVGMQADAVPQWTIVKSKRGGS